MLSVTTILYLCITIHKTQISSHNRIVSKSTRGTTMIILSGNSKEEPMYYDVSRLSKSIAMTNAK